MDRRGPTLLNLPPPPSDPTTPNEMGPGTPNSATTSMSTLSVVAIKDGAIGHGGRGNTRHSADAERADRISRLAGLEPVATARTPSHLGPGGQYPLSYFDNAPQIKERSTVGSASATDSVSQAGRRTWASGSIDYDADKMSESQDQDDGTSSVGGMDDEERASLVGFGEGAGSTVSGPISTASNRAMAARGFASPSTPRTGAPASASGQSTPMSGIVPTTAAGSTDPKMMDGMSYDPNIVDTTMQPAPPISQPQQGNRFSGVGTAEAEAIMRDRLSDGDIRRGMGTPDNQHLGRFPFEKE